MVRILPSQEATKTGHVLGAALALDSGRSGNLATVYFGGVDALTGGDRVLQPLLLGYSIAHELGHLLLGPGSHSERGIMIARWREKVLQGAPKAAFLFTRREAERVRASVLARMRAAAEAPTAVEPVSAP